MAQWRTNLKVANLILLIMQEVLDITRLIWDMCYKRSFQMLDEDEHESEDKTDTFIKTPLLVYWIIFSLTLLLANLILAYAVIQELWDFLDGSFHVGIIKSLILFIDLFVAVSHDVSKRQTNILLSYLTLSATFDILLFFAIAVVQMLICVSLYLLYTTSVEGRQKYTVEHACAPEVEDDEEVLKSGGQRVVCIRTIVKNVVVFLIVLVIAVYLYTYILAVENV